MWMTCVEIQSISTTTHKSAADKKVPVPHTLLGPEIIHFHHSYPKLISETLISISISIKFVEQMQVTKNVIQALRDQQRENCSAIILLISIWVSINCPFSEVVSVRSGNNFHEFIVFRHQSKIYTPFASLKIKRIFYPPDLFTVVGVTTLPPPVKAHKL